MRYSIRDREAGNVICSFTSIEEAEDQIQQFECDDASEGIYVADFYEIYVEV